MPSLLALDQGTTSSRAILFELDGAVRGVEQREFEQIFPQPGWVEHDAEQIWTTQRAVMDDVVRRTQARDDIVAIGITNQRETTVVWDRASGVPIANAIVWQDRRTADVCDRRRADAADLVRDRAGLEIDAYFSATKIAWILDNVPGARDRAARGELAAGTIDSWLLWKLTEGAVHATDTSNASRTMLWNLHTRDWDDDLLALWNVPREVLPDVRPSSGVLATARVEGRDIPIAGIAGDQQAALFGQACHRPGMVKCTYGTGCFLLANVGEKPAPAAQRLLSTVAWTIGDATHYALEGSVFMGGATVQWLRDGLGIIADAKEIEGLAASVPDTGDVVLVPAFAGLGAPHWDQSARGTIVGMTRGTTRAHLARAALEGIAHQVVDVLEAMDEALPACPANGNAVRVDGGAVRNDLLMQIQADLLGRPLVRPTVVETTALGAAYLAGLAVGAYADLDAVALHWQSDRVFEPNLTADDVRRRRSDWRRAVERARDWARP